MKQIYFIINPKARNGYCMKIWDKLENKLVEENITYQATFTEYPGHAKSLAAEIAASNDEEKIMIAVGGDGTMHEVMNGMINYKNIILGFVPGGSGNDFSRGFHIPSDPIEALQVMLRLMKSDAPLIDAGKVTMTDHAEHYFINNMGVGFDALVSHAVNQSRMKGILNKLSMGRLIYVYFLLKKLFTYKCTSIELSIEGKKHLFDNTWFVTVSNQPYYGGGMKIAPNAVPDDGIFEITVVHNLSRIKLLLVFISVFWGKHIHFKEVETFQGSMVTIQSESPVFIHADGEIIGFTPLNMQVHSKAVQVLTPKVKDAIS
ncbi:diacylglycerol kinase family protein [Neobacillus sp. FSL H8-0543]|uniref:diacylglycerol/lipid kinase family protein n=1 Tax=Neobacillus sp. FSL H8-0543 TaxID=2954672 RepID=UPI0031598C52